MATKQHSRTAAAAALFAALVALAPLAADPAWALTIAPPPPCVVELKPELTTWGKAGCGAATPVPATATVTSSVGNDDALPRGITLVEWTASLSGETVSAWQAVVVADTTSPTIGSPAPVHTTTTAATAPPPAAFGNTASVAPTGHTSVTCDSPGQLKAGITRITCTANDASNNSVAATWAAVVKDTAAPTITIPPNTRVEVEATEALSLPADLTFVKPAAADLVTEMPDVSYLSPTQRLPLGDSTITWIATDEAGNSATAQQTVTLVDTTAPTITPTTSVPVPPGSPIGSPQVFDAVDPSPEISSRNTGTAQNPTVTWTATDDHKNTSTFVQSTSPLATEPFFAMTKVRTLAGPWGLGLEGYLTLVSKDYLIYKGLTSGDGLGGNRLLAFNPVTGAEIVLPENTEWTTATHITPIRSSSGDHRFAARCDCATSGNGIHIFNAAMPTAVKTLTPPQVSDGRTAHYGAMASSGGLLFVQAYTTEPTANLEQRWISRVHAYDTKTWKLKYEIENPTPFYGDQFGKLLWTGQGTAHAKEALYVWSKYSASAPSHDSPEIQVFNTANGQLIHTTTDPQIADSSVSQTPAPTTPRSASSADPHTIKSFDMVSYADGVFASTRTNDNEKIINYKKDGSTGIMHRPSCCLHYFGSGMAPEGNLLYASAWTNTANRIIHAFDTGTNTLARTYSGDLHDGALAPGVLGDMEYLGNNKIAAVEISGRFAANTHLLELHPTTPAQPTASAQAATPAITLVRPLLLYAEPTDNNTTKLVYDTTLSPRVINALDYEMDDNYRITAVSTAKDSVLITYASAAPKPASTPAVYQVGDISYPAFEVSPNSPPIDFNVDGLDGAKIKTGSTRTFEVVVTRVEGGGAAIILLAAQPDFVTVQNTEFNRATITINASHATAAAGNHTFTVLAATGSNPTSKSITISIIP